MDDHKTWLAGVFDRAAPTYDRVGDAYHEHFAGRLLDLVPLPDAAHLLDVACGRGAVLRAAAARGVDRLTGVDFSPTMLDLAGDDLRAAGIADVDLRVMDAEQLEFDDASFDVLTAAFALFFLPRPERAAAEFHRVLRPAGVVAVSTWGEDDERWRFEGELLASLGAPPLRALQHPFDTPDDVTALLMSAGFSNLQAHLEETEIAFSSKDEWWAWRWSFSGRGLLEQLDPSVLAAYRAACFDELDALHTRVGYPLRLRALLVTGRT